MNNEKHVSEEKKASPMPPVKPGDQKDTAGKKNEEDRSKFGDQKSSEKKDLNSSPNDQKN